MAEDWRVDIPVENQQVINYMEQLRNEITHHLRMQLHNGKITLNFRLIEAKEQKRAYSRREQYALMLKKNPELAELAKILKLELA